MSYNSRAMRVSQTREYEGELDDGSRPSVHYARDYFLLVVGELVPEVLDDLASEPLECYRRSGIRASSYAREDLAPITLDMGAEGIGGWRYINEEIYPDWLTCFEDGVSDGRLSELRQKIFEWSRRSNLNEAWCRSRAYNTLFAWCEDDTSWQQRCWGFEPVIQSTLHFEQTAFRFEYETDYPREGRRSELEQEITNEFKRQLRSYFDELEALAGEAGMRPAPKMRDRKHFEWLVRYHVQKWNYDKIIAGYGVQDSSNVRHTVPALSAYIGLTLDNRRGRPRRS
jgi:hypothetical protein